MSEAILKDTMQNIEVNLGERWVSPNLFTGTKEDLIAAGLAREFMFAELPKRSEHGSRDCNGWPIVGHPNDYPDKYDWLGKTRPIFWSTKRIKGGKFTLTVDKSWEEVQRLKTPPQPPLTEDSFLEDANIKVIGAAIAIKIVAGGASDRNPKGYYLSKKHEIAQLIDRVVEAVKTSTVITTRKDKPFTVIEGGKE